MKLGKKNKILSPNRAYSFGFVNHFGNCETITDFVFRTSRDGFFYEHGYARKVLEDL